MTAGIELIRRKCQGEAHALSTPLLTDTTGNKLGKTEGGTIFLDPSLTSPYRFYQYWLNQADSEVLNILSALTLLSPEYIRSLKSKIKTEPEKREAQKILAQELTIMIHGKDSHRAVEKASQVLFSRNPENLNLVDEKTLIFLAREVPSSSFSNSSPTPLLEVLEKTKLCKSKGDARRQIKAGAIYLNYEKVNEESLLLSKDSFKGRAFLLLGKGKKELHLLKQS